MGWQRDDPTSDFRGGGYFALQLLLSLGQVLARSQPLCSCWSNRAEPFVPSLVATCRSACCSC